MKWVNLTALMLLCGASFAQDVRFDYSRSANFGAYKTYQWVDSTQAEVGDPLLHQDIRRAVDEQLAGKGLRCVETGADLVVGYEARISEEQQFDALGSGFGGLGWGPGLGSFANVHGTTSAVDVGTLIVGIFDPADKQLIWRGLATRTLNLNKDPDKNYRTLQKAMAKLFRNYPPGAGKR
jgi:hypothetical protein